MTRVAVIGSSHVAALKLAWDQIGLQHPSIKVDYLSVKRPAFEQATLRKDMRFGLPDDIPEHPDTARHARKILDFTQFDLVWNVGIWQILPRDFNAMIEAFNVDGFPATTHPHQMSRAAFTACIGDMVKNVLPGPEWHHLETPRIWYSGFPRRNEHMATRKRFRDVDTRNHGLCWDQADQTLAAALADRGIGWVRQPADTLTEHGFTQARFGTDMTVPGGDGVDIAHMNAAFGARMWDVFLSLAVTQ